MDKTIKHTVEQFYALNEDADNEIALMITIPKTIKWQDYVKEIVAVADGTQEMNYKVSSKPTKVHVGSKCFICHDGIVRGWMTISSIERKSFRCSTTGKDWAEAWYISRSGEFHPLESEVRQRGFMGYNYVKVSDYVG